MGLAWPLCQLGSFQLTNVSSQLTVINSCNKNIID